MVIPMVPSICQMKLKLGQPFIKNQTKLFLATSKEILDKEWQESSPQYIYQNRTKYVAYFIHKSAQLKQPWLFTAVK